MDDLERKFRDLPIENRVLKNLPVDAEFRKLYRPAAVPSKLFGGAEAICFFAAESFLRTRASSELLVLSYREVGL
jgi:hypothetical protein